MTLFTFAVAQRRALAVIVLVLATSVFPALAAANGTIAGRVINAGGEPATDAQVALVALRRQSAVDPQGRFRFENIPPGTHLLEVTSLRFGSTVQKIKLAEGETTDLTISVDLSMHREEVTVTAAVDPRAAGELVSPVSVLSGQELQAAIQPTLGETLAAQPGVSGTSYGQGASRPVIRGLGGDRIAVLQDGLTTGDVSTTSPDHAVSSDPLAVERIEVVRGPATLLYGSSAVGGAVNVLDDTIPSVRPSQPIEGFVDLGYGDNAGEKHAALSLTGGAGSLAWHAHGTTRDADDYTAGDDRDVPNSFLSSDDRAFGAAWVGSRGYLGASIGRFDTNYGNPAEPGISVDLERTRYDLRGELARPLPGLSSARLRIGAVDYQHTEFEGSEPGTVFTSDGWEARLDAVHLPIARLSGSLGLQLGSTDLEAVGAEGFIPYTTSDEAAVFVVEELTSGSVNWQAGARYELRDHATRQGLDRDFSGLSASFGAVYKPSEAWNWGLSIARSTKLPNAEELFSDGPHAATGQFELGDPDLARETSLGADFTVRRLTGRATGELSLFYNRFSDFIYERLTGELREVEIDGAIEEFPVAQFSQQDARFVGAELHGDIQLLHTEPHHLALEISADIVRAELDQGGDLPRIPPLRLGIGLHYAGQRWWAESRVRRVTKQDRIAAFETATAGYTVVDASLGYRFFLANTVHDLLLRARNLTDELARNHVSFLKEVAPLPGRDISLSYRVTF